MTEGLDKTNFFEDINTSFAFKPIAESGSFFLGPTSKVISRSIFPHFRRHKYSHMLVLLYFFSEI